MDVNYLLFRYEKREERGGMRDLVSAFEEKDDMFDVINTIINSREFSEEDRLHFYDVEENVTFDIKTKRGFELLKRPSERDKTPTLGEMSGLADLKKQMEK